MSVVKEVIDTIYEPKKSDYEKNSKKKKRINEIIKNLENTIKIEKSKVGGGNSDLIEKLQYKLEDLQEL